MHACVGGVLIAGAARGVRTGVFQIVIRGAKAPSINSTMGTSFGRGDAVRITFTDALSALVLPVFTLIKFKALFSVFCLHSRRDAGFHACSVICEHLCMPGVSAYAQRSQTVFLIWLDVAGAPNTFGPN